MGPLEFGLGPISPYLNPVSAARQYLWLAAGQGIGPRRALTLARRLVPSLTLEGVQNAYQSYTNEQTTKRYVSQLKPNAIIEPSAIYQGSAFMRSRYSYIVKLQGTTIEGIPTEPQYVTVTSGRLITKAQAERAGLTMFVSGQSGNLSFEPTATLETIYQNPNTRYL